MSDVWSIPPDDEMPTPVFPFTVCLESSEGRECIITLNADGTWKGDADHLESALIEMAADNSHIDAVAKVTLWLLLCELRRGGQT